MYILFLIYLPPPSWHQVERFLLDLCFCSDIFSWPFLNGNILFYNFQTGVTRLLVVFPSHYSLGHGEFSAADGGGAGDFDYSNAKAPKTGKINSKPTFNSGCNMPLKAHQVVWGVSVDSCQISLEMFIKVQLWALARPLCYLGLCLGLLSCWKINLHPGWVPLEQVINKSVSILLHLSFHPP